MAAKLGSERRPRVGLVVAAHAPLAGALVNTARDIVGERWAALADGLVAVEVNAQAGAAAAFQQIADAITTVDRGAGALVLADLFGGSAANVALAQLGQGRVEVVTGVNLAMLLEALSQRDEWGAPTMLGEKVAEAARQSVVVAGPLLSSEEQPGEAAA